MKKLIQEIRKQPLYIRHIFMWTMVVITFSVVGFLWYRETENNFVALLNPKPSPQATAAAQTQESSPFAAIGKTSPSDTAKPLRTFDSSSL